ncbi:MAG: PAS domain-containing protein, partial [Candidatus Hermodarchaeota archaeon]
MENISEIEDLSNKNKEIFYNSLFRSFPDLLFIVDVYGKIIDISNSFFKLFNTNLKREDLIGKSGFKFVDPKYLRLARKNHKKGLEEGYITNAVYKLKKLDGSIFYGKISASVVKDEEGNPKYFIGVLRDVTNEKNLKTELKKSREMFQLVVDNIPQFIFWKDINSVYLGCNKNFS